MSPALPVGYKLLDDKLLKTYVLKRGDYISFGSCISWTKIGGRSGYDYELMLKTDKIKLLYIAIKGKTPPRFKTKRKYPWGY